MLPEWLFLMPLDVISRQADKLGLDKLIVTAIVMVESSGKSWRTRYEPGYPENWMYKPEVFAKQLGISLDSEKNLQRTSWGLMQVMLATARDHGFEGAAIDLCIPDVGVEYGCIYLKYQINRYNGNIQEALAAYNRGSAIQDLKNPGFFKNQKYVNKIMKYYNQLKGE